MVRLPDDSQRLVILGKTGTGKSVVGAYHLSRRSFDIMPWIIFDPKYDELMNSFGAVEISIYENPPTAPGLYIVHPVPESDDDAVEDFLRKIINRATSRRIPTGIYFDEGYSIPSRSRAFRQILTQGRSLKVPAIVLSQRPVWMDRFVWSEADFVQYLGLNTMTDKKHVMEWMPINAHEILPTFHSKYYDVGRNTVTTFKPVPPPDKIRAVIRRRLLGPPKKGRVI